MVAVAKKRSMKTATPAPIGFVRPTEQQQIDYLRADVVALDAACGRIRAAAKDEPLSGEPLRVFFVAFRAASELRVSLELRRLAGLEVDETKKSRANGNSQCGLTGAKPARKKSNKRR